MTKMLSICGIDCSVCPAFVARRTNDQALREKTAVEWTQQYGHPIKPEDINCVGCVVREGVHIAHCGECDVRACGLTRRVKNCAYCDEYSTCATLSKFHEMVPQARENLEELRRALAAGR